MQQCDSGATLTLADSELIHALVDVQQDAAAVAAAAVATAVDDDNESGDGDSQSSQRVSHQRNASEEELQDDTNVEDIVRNLKTSQSEAKTVTYVQTHTDQSQDLDQRSLDKECQTFCQQYETSDHQCQTLEQLCEKLDHQCQLFDQHNSQIFQVDQECQTVDLQRTMSDSQSQVFDEQNEALDRVNRRHQSTDRKYQDVNEECQTLYQECQYNSDDKLDSRQSETETKDVHCQTTQEACQLSSTQVQTDDSGVTVAETHSIATETDIDDVNQRQQETIQTTCDTELLQVLNPLKPNFSICYICHTGLTYHF